MSKFVKIHKKLYKYKGIDINSRTLILEEDGFSPEPTLVNLDNVNYIENGCVFFKDDTVFETGLTTEQLEALINEDRDGI